MRRLYLLFLFFTGLISSAYAQNMGFEAPPVTPPTNWAPVTLVWSNTATAGTVRTGAQAMTVTAPATTGSTAGCTNGFVTTATSGSYLITIGWGKVSGPNNAAFYLGYRTGATNTLNPSTTGAPPVSYYLSSTSWTRIASASASTVAAGSYGPAIRAFSIGTTAGTVLYMDDFIIYASASNVPDLTAPSPANNVYYSGNSVNWANGADNGAPASGISGVVIIRADGAGLAAPTLNDQAMYSEVNGAAGTSSFSANGSTWTVVANLSGTGTTSFTDASAGAGPYTYVVYMRDMAYNYSTGIPAIIAAPCTNPPVAGVPGASPSTPQCASVPVVLTLTGSSSGLGQTFQWQSSATANGTYTNVGSAQTSPTITINPTSDLYYRCEIICSAGTPSYSTPLLVSVVPALPAGTYTINAGAATGNGNFHSFTDAVNAMTCGIAGPVTFNVVAGSGPYDEQVTIPQVTGASSTNTITINGNNNTLIYGATTAAAPHTLQLNGTDYLTVNNLNIEGTGTSYALACHLWNQTDNNTFNNCTFTAPANGSTSTQVPFSISGSETVATTAGISGNNNLISGCSMINGYYGACIVGNTTTTNTGNQVVNCTVKDFYNTGLYVYYQNGAIIRGNLVERPTRTTLTTFNGIYILTGCTNTLVESNKIRNPFGGDPSNTGTAYAIYSSIDGTAGNENKYINNLVYNMNGNGTIAGLYLTGADYVQAYHNTIVLDDITATVGIAYGIYSTGTVGGMTYKNNNIYITRTGSGAKYCLYFSGAGTKVSNKNNLYITPSATNYTGYFSTGIVTLANWQAANSSAWDAGSIAVDPYFTNAGTGDFTPGNGALENIAEPVNVLTDINNAPRSVATPDIGAYEYAVGPCNNSPVAGTAVSSAAAVCTGGIVHLSLSGFSGGNGTTVQWQSAPTGTGNWLDIPGANVPNYYATVTTSTDYQAVVTCSLGGGTATSNTVTVAINPFYLCYCSPNTGVTLHGTTGNYITNFTIPNTTLNNTTTAVGPGGHLGTNPSTPANTATLAQNTSYTLSATLTSASYRAEAWMDWNQNGVFEATEYITFTMTGAVANATVVPPMTALTGMTGLRVRVIASTTVTYGDAGACANVSTGRETEDYAVTIVPPPTCAAPVNPVTGPITANSASLGWTSSATLWEIEYGVGNFALGTGTRMVVNTNPYTVSPLAGGTNYSFFVRNICAPADSSAWTVRKTFGTPPVNDDAVNATLLTVGTSTCNGTSYNGVTTGATLQTGEPIITCQQTATTTSTVWYKFVAPNPGMVRVSTDYTVSAFDSLIDSKMAVYSVGDVNDFTTFQILGCDDDNGVVAEGYRNIIYLADLIPGNTYYVKVDKNNPANPDAAFCIDIMPLNASMISTAANCTGTAHDNSDWQLGGAAWVSMLDNTGKLIYNLKTNTSTGLGDIKTKFYEQSGAARTYNGTPYLNRNYEITVTTAASQPIGLQFFFTDADFNSLATAIPGLSMSDLNVTRLASGLCANAFNPASQTATLLTQSANGSGNGVRYITTQTPGFSSFFIHANTAPLAINLGSISATNSGSRNRIDWTTLNEGKGDYFVVERSADGKNYTELGTIEAKGQAGSYSYWDASPVNGINYYRLKIVDAAGGNEYSRTVTAIVTANGTFTVEAYPNPVKNVLTVKVFGIQSDKATVFVTDITGKTVKEISVKSNLVDIDMSGMAEGVYLIRYTDSNHTRTIKVNKQ